jgi:hypothetical protein
LTGPELEIITDTGNLSKFLIDCKRSIRYTSNQCDVRDWWLASMMLIPSPFIESIFSFFGDLIKMEVKLYVGNLPYSATEDELRTMFGQAGTVKSVAIITDRETRRSKGFGFVEMSSQTEAEAAIRMFHDSDLNGRALTVNIARPREERPRRSFNRGGGRDGGRSRNQGGGRREY